MKEKYKVELTERDWRILALTFEQRVVTWKQIAIRFFSASTRQAAQKRISELVSTKYLSVMPAESHGRAITTYRLGDRGEEVLRKNYRFELTHPVYKSDSVLHDIALVDIRERFEKAKMLREYYPENVLQVCGSFKNSDRFRAFVEINSDAALILNTPAGELEVALEYEASEQNRARYGKKLLDYYLSNQIAGVFYICGNSSIERLIRKTDLEISNTFMPKIFTCLKSTFQTSENALPFVNKKNATFFVK